MSAITPEAIQQARLAAGANRRRVVDVLEENLNADPDTFTARLAATLRLARLSMAELRQAEPAFELLPFAECSRRGCVLLRTAEGRLILALDDPFDSELQAWGEERVAEPFHWALVHRGDLVAFLGAHE